MNRKVNFSIVLVLAMFILSCQKDFLDINHNPNRTSESSVQLTFPAGVASTAYVVGGYYQLAGGFWSQHWTQSVGASQWRELDQYNIKTSDFDDNQWGELYSGALNDYEYVRKVALKDQNWSYYFMATVMQAYTYQVLADLYGKIPYSEALKGNEGLLTPKWDDASVVYDGIIAKINEAMSHDYKTFKSNSNLTATAIEPGKDDMLFMGDMDLWEQFANTLKLKIYLRQMYVRPSVAQAGIASLYSSNVTFLATDAKINQFGDEENKRNPAYETFVDRLGGNLSGSKSMVEYLEIQGDPRLSKLYAMPSKLIVGHTDYTYYALRQGDFFSSIYGAGANIQNLCTPKLSALDPVYFISESESYFLQAEAIAKGWGTGDAKSLYEAGIEASFAKLGAVGASSLYGAGAPYAFVAAPFDSAQQCIMVQKWIAMTNSQGIECFIEHNRTHFPAENPDNLSNFPGQFNVSYTSSAPTGLFPKRFLFPESETKRNPNTPAVLPITQKVWYDAK